jgi:hypothetical protein
VDQLDSASQAVYNGLDFHFLQVVYWTGTPAIELDGVTLGIYGYQKFRRDKDHPFNKLRLIPTGGRIIVIVGQWFEDAETTQPSTTITPP